MSSRIWLSVIILFLGLLVGCVSPPETAKVTQVVDVDDIFVNAELVSLGLAEAKDYPPDIKYQDHLEELESEARLAGRGMWAK